MKITNFMQKFTVKKIEASLQDGSNLKFIPRPYQEDLDREIESNPKLPIFMCWSRRLGKDQWAFARAAKLCMENKNSRVVYVFPTAKQGKTNILEGVTEPDGKVYGERWITSVIHPGVLKRPKTGAFYFSDNSIRFKNGSIITIVGADADNLVGGNINLLVISEAALVDKSVFDYLFPSVNKVDGDIICISTPRDGSWFNEIMKDPESLVVKSILPAKAAYLDIEKKKPVYTSEQLEKARKLMSIEKFESDYECNLTAHTELSIYGKSLAFAKMIPFPDIKQKTIFVASDLGITDNSSWVFFLFEDNKMKVFHHYRNKGVGTQHCIDYFERWMKENGVEKKNLHIILPHDGGNKIDGLNAIVSRRDYYAQAGFNVRVLSRIPVLQGIEITRAGVVSGDIEFAQDPAVYNLINIVKTYEWRTSPRTKEIIFVPKHGTGYSASNDADSLEYGAILCFYEKYISNLKIESGVINNSMDDFYR